MRKTTRFGEAQRDHSLVYLSPYIHLYYIDTQESARRGFPTMKFPAFMALCIVFFSVSHLRKAIKVNAESIISR